LIYSGFTEVSGLLRTATEGRLAVDAVSSEPVSVVST
jgi:hypothetical protein